MYLDGTVHTGIRHRRARSVPCLKICLACWLDHHGRSNKSVPYLLQYTDRTVPVRTSFASEFQNVRNENLRKNYFGRWVGRIAAWCGRDLNDWSFSSTKYVFTTFSYLIISISGFHQKIKTEARAKRNFSLLTPRGPLINTYMTVPCTLQKVASPITKSAPVIGYRAQSCPQKVAKDFAGDSSNPSISTRLFYQIRLLSTREIVLHSAEALSSLHIYILT